MILVSSKNHLLGEVSYIKCKTIKLACHRYYVKCGSYLVKDTPTKYLLTIVQKNVVLSDLKVTYNTVANF